MKHTILTIALLAATICSYATPFDEAPSVPPIDVINALKSLGETYGIKDQKSMTEKRSSVNDALESAIIIIPFECPNGVGIMAGVKEAFVEDKDCGFQFGVYEPGQGSIFNTNTGNKTREFIMTRENRDQGYYYINVKNSDNPMLRDHYSIQWQAFGDKIKGKIFMITSLRPDLIIEEDSEDDDSPDLCPVEDVFDEADISSLGKMMSSLQKELNKQLQEMRKAQEQAAPDLADSPNGKLERQLHAYKQLLEMQEEQIDKLQKDYKNNFHNPGARREINKRLRKLHKEAQKTTDKMEKLIKQMR